METLIDGFNDFSLELLQNIQYHQPEGILKYCFIKT